MHVTGPPSTMTALELESVSRQFVTPDGGSYRALDNVSLVVPAGAFVAIVGPSGCGKSTLLNIAAGSAAAIVRTASAWTARRSGLNRRATYMFQQDALLPWKNVRENVALGLTLGGVAERRRARARERVARARGPVGVRRALSVAAERRHAQARRRWRRTGSSIAGCC